MLWYGFQSLKIYFSKEVGQAPINFLMESPIAVGFVLPYSPEVPTIYNIYAMMWFSKVLK